MSVVEPKDAATLIIATPDGRVLLGERSRQLAFLGGYLAFPGGRLDAQDELQARAHAPGHKLLICALRELHEESGLVTDGHSIALHEGDFEGWLKSAKIDASRFKEAGCWITPDFAKKRYKTRFFLLVLEQTELPKPKPQEFEWLDWLTPESCLADYRNFKAVLSPPIKVALEVLHLGLKGADRRLMRAPGSNGELSLDAEPIFGIRVLPLLTPTLPPATHTNAYIVGHERAIIVDPATYDNAQRERLMTLLQLIDVKLEAIVLTHHHLDHTGSAAWLSKALDLKIYAHPITAKLLEGRIEIFDHLNEGDEIDLGKDGEGRDFKLKALFTPGHAPGHLVLVDQREGANVMIVGDMVAAIGSIIIDPPEGDMAEYLRQLRRLLAMPPGCLMPAHGPPILDGPAKLQQYIDHRLMRERKVLDALVQRGESDPFELLPAAYDETPAALYPLAARACLAHLLKLVEDGIVRRSGDRFLPINPDF